jgi:hypothetical protein
MLSLNQVERQLNSATRKYDEFKDVFKSLAEEIERGPDPANPRERQYIIPGLTTSLYLQKDHFIISGLGRSILFSFKLYINENDRYIGKVECYLKNDFPELKYTLVNDFTFKENGETSIREVGDFHDLIYLNHGTGNFYIIYNFIFECLPH